MKHNCSILELSCVFPNFMFLCSFTLNVTASLVLMNCSKISLTPNEIELYYFSDQLHFSLVVKLRRLMALQFNSVHCISSLIDCILVQFCLMYFKFHQLVVCQFCSIRLQGLHYLQTTLVINLFQYIIIWTGSSDISSRP